MAVATETEVQRVPPAGKTYDEDWKPLGLYHENIEAYYKEALMDVVKITARTSKLKSVPITSISDETWVARDELQKDPYNMKRINNVGYCYWKEGQHEQSLNVMMRGWKRAVEIPDAKIRFRFLMKLAELSMGLWKHRQGLAIFRDLEEPVDPQALKAYLILGTQLWCHNGDMQQGLKFFKRCIEGEPYEAAIRIFAVLVLELKKVGGYEAARSSMEQLLPNGHTADLVQLDSFLESIANKKTDVSPDQLKRRFHIGLGTIATLAFLGLLYWLETHSFAAIAAAKEGRL